MRMGFFRVFRGLIIVSNVLIEFNIIGNQRFLKSMFIAFFGHVNIAIFEDNLSGNALMAFIAKAYCGIVIDI
jgi:hypothetical protein